MKHPDCLRIFAERAEVVSATRFLVEGDSFDVPSAASTDPAMTAVVAHLEQILYHRLYTRPSPAGTPVSHTLQREFVARVSAANAGRGTFESGWVVKRLEPDGSIAVERDGLTVWALPHEFVSPAGAPEAGMTGMVRIGKEQRSRLPGFYLAFGDAPLPHDADTQCIVRLYWHISAAGAPPLVRALTVELNSRHVPFRFKTLSDPQLYSRADAAVLYMTRRDYFQARSALVKVYRLVKPWLRPGEPLMTKPLGTGVGLAEDPGGALESFGQHRCRMVAESLWRSFEAGRLTAGQRFEDLGRLFAERGFDAARLYLQPGSRDEYVALERRRRATRKAR
jgi:type III HopA1-like effector protein